MPGGGRRISRNSRPQNATGSAVSAPLLTGSTGDVNAKYSPLGGNSGGYSIPGLEIPTAPKHIPFPNIPMNGELLFEIIMFVFTTAAAGLQFLQIYRSVWWLPHAYTHHAMVSYWNNIIRHYSHYILYLFQNFYLIDVHLVMFILVLFARRLIYMLGCMILQRFAPAKILPFVFEFYRYVL